MNDVYAKLELIWMYSPTQASFCGLFLYGVWFDTCSENLFGWFGYLAGDYLKEASDSNVDMCGVGFLYRYGYLLKVFRWTDSR